jgi:hypothetical protein
VEEQRGHDAGIDEPRVAFTESEVAQKAVAIATEKIEIPTKRSLHLGVAIDPGAVRGAEDHLEVEIGLRRQQAKKWRLILDDVRGDEGDSMHAVVQS